MDPLTHAATGLFLSRIGLKRWTPLATPILLLAATAPDCDIVSAAGGTVSYLHYHRYLTHSLAAMPVMALGVVALVRAVSRKKIHWWGGFCAALIGVASHLLLDLTNPYGVRLLLPFSARWLRLDLTNVVDVWIWGVFLLCIVSPFLAELVGSEIASRSTVPPIQGRGFAWLALGFLLLYNCGRGVLRERAIAQLESRVYDNAAPLRTLAVPAGPDNPLLWKGIVETRDFYAVADVDLTAEFDPTRAAIYYKPPAGPALDAAARLPEFQPFLEWSKYPLWRVAPAPDVENGQTVEVMDLRYGSPAYPAFVMSTTLDENLRPGKSEFQFDPRPKSK